MNFDDITSMIVSGLGAKVLGDPELVPRNGNFQELCVGGVSQFLHFPAGSGINVELGLATMFESPPEHRLCSRGEVIAELLSRRREGSE